MQAPKARAKVGIVLSGGGSRGAYEAGIFHYIRTDLAKRLGRHVPIDIITGTSVGPINAAFITALTALITQLITLAAVIFGGWVAVQVFSASGHRGGNTFNIRKAVFKRNHFHG